MTRTQGYLYMLIIFAIVVAGLAMYTQRGFILGVGRSPAPQIDQATVPLSAHMQAELAQSRGFQYVISYTDKGFVPQDLTIPAGDTVRFVNSSHSDLWVAATGKPLYPSSATSCGESSLDSCGPLHSGEFWEFTFEAKGTWGYTNNLMSSSTGGSIIVQ